MRNVFVTALTAGCGGGDTATVESIAPREAAGADVLLVDVRERPELAAGRAPTAVHVPLAQVQDRLDEIEDRAQGRRVAFSCRTGRRSAEAAKTAVEVGIDDVRHVPGGMGAWTSGGLPVERAG